MKKSEKTKIKLLSWLISFRSVSRSEEQQKLKLAIQKKYGGEIIDGNLIITKGKPTVAIVAHLDINQPKGEAAPVIRGDTFSSSNGIGCGFDDKAGICFALDYLSKNDNIQVILTEDEEIGCIGASKVRLNENINFLVQLDRRGKSDISQYTNGIYCVNEDTKPFFYDVMQKYGFQWANCVYTDVGEIAQNNEVQCVNISCGYYNEHRPDEHLNIPEFMNACDFASELIQIASSHSVPPLEVVLENWDCAGRGNSFFDDDIYSCQDSSFDEDTELYYLLDVLDGLTESQINRLKKIIKFY